jgi:hypothetical protein
VNRPRRIGSAVTIAFLAITLLQEDGLLLAVSFTASIISLLVFCFVVWRSGGAKAFLGMVARALIERLSEGRTIEIIGFSILYGTHVVGRGCIVTVA